MIGDDGALGTRLEVASVTTGQLTAVPGSSVSNDALVGFAVRPAATAWSPEFAFATKTQLASWHPGAAGGRGGHPAEP